MLWWILGGSVIALAILGTILNRKDRAQAPAKLKEAEAAFARGDLDATLKLLKDAFWVPTDDKYDAEAARVAYEAVALLDRTLRKMDLDPYELVYRALPELQVACASGATIEASVTDPVRHFLDDDSDGWLKTATARKRSAPQPLTPPPAFVGPAINDEGEHAKHTNAIGRAILLNNLDEGLALIDKLLPHAQGEFRGMLFNQRGGIHSMKNNNAAALADYEQACEAQPDDLTNWSNLAEAYERDNQRQQAREAAERVVRGATSDKDLRTNAQAIIRRVTTIPTWPTATA